MAHQLYRERIESQFQLVSEVINACIELGDMPDSTPISR